MYKTKKIIAVKVLVMALCMVFIFTSTVFGFTWGPNCNLITNNNMYWPASALSTPGYLQTVTDPDFGTKITRITGDPGTAIPNVTGGIWGTTARHNYSKDPAWNADQSLLVLKTNKGGSAAPANSMIFLDGSTYQVKFNTDQWATEFRWHPTDPNNMVYISGNELGYWNPTTDTKTVITTFSDLTDCYFGPWEGNLSNDGKFVVIQSGSIAFAYDMVNKVRYPNISIGRMKLDWASISPLGNYVVLHGTVGGAWDNTRVYTKDGTLIQTWSEKGQPSHYDMTVDSDGSEVAVGSARSAPYNGQVIKRRLSDGVKTQLVSAGYAYHTSTRCLNREGWAIVTYNYRNGYDPYRNELCAVKLDGTRVERICHLYALDNSYDAEPQGCVSPDGLKVVFASNWESTSNPIQAYVVDFSDKVIP